MEFKQIYTKGLAHLSYVVIGKESCLVVDPSRDIEKYLEIAEEAKLPIVAILETHLHADFISGHMDLAKETGATIYITKKAGAEYDHYGLENGEVITIDDFSIKMMDTPGHTPECSVFVVSDLARGPLPALMFSGDTLLIGDVGRPDLFPDIKEQLASDLFDSMRSIENLGDQIEVYPAHGAGSLCGKKLSAKLTSTLGTERLYNQPMNIETKEGFIDQLLHDMPEAPDHFARCSEINRKGPQIINELPSIEELTSDEFHALLDGNYLVVDTRDQLSFCSAHIPGAYGLSIRGNFATFAGWVLPPDKPILLIADNDEDLHEAIIGLRRVGLDQIKGYLKGGMSSWESNGYYTASIDCISVEELKDRLGRDELLLVDTRLKSEYDLGHIEGAIHVPAPDVRERYKDWEDSDKPVAFICNTGNRSLLAASLMVKFSTFDQVINVIGGASAWEKMGYKMVK